MSRVVEETRDRLSELPFIEEREKSLAKVSKAMNRLKRLGQEERVELALEQLNLRLHLDEVLTTLVDILANGGVKLKEVDKLVAVVVSLHLSYNKQVLTTIEQAAVAVLTGSAVEAVRKRAALRLLAELNLLFPREVKKADAIVEFLASLVSAPDLSSLVTLNSFITRYPKEVFPAVAVRLDQVFSEATAGVWRAAAAEDVRKAEETASQVRISAGVLDEDTQNKLKDARSLVAKVDLQITTLLAYIGRVATPPEATPSPSEVEAAPVADDIYQLKAALSVAETAATWSSEEQAQFIAEFEDVRDVATADAFVARRAKEVSRWAQRWLVTRLTKPEASEVSRKSSRRRTPRSQMRVAQMRVLATVATGVREFQTLVTSEATRTKPGRVSAREAELAGELTNFQVIPARYALDILEESLASAQLELATVVLQSCGRWLLNNADTKTLVEAQLERLWRFKNTKHLPESVEAAIEDVYFMLKPEKLPLTKPGGRGLSELELFIDHLLANPKVIYAHEELAWKLDACVIADAKLTRRALLALRYPAVSVVHVAAALAQFPGNWPFFVALIDDLFESIQRGLEADDPLMASHRYREAALVCELFMEQVLDFDCVFDFVANLLGFGGLSQHGARNFRPKLAIIDRKSLAAIPEDESDEGGCSGGSGLLDFEAWRHPDAPAERVDSFLRARMVYKVLEVCGTCLAKNRFKDLNWFGVVLQASCFARPDLPNDLRLQVLTLLESLGLTLVPTLAEAVRLLNEDAVPSQGRKVVRVPVSKVPIVDPRTSAPPLLDEQRELDAALAELMGGGVSQATTRPREGVSVLEYEGVRVLRKPKVREQLAVITAPEGMEILLPKRAR